MHAAASFYDDAHTDARGTTWLSQLAASPAEATNPPDLDLVTLGELAGELADVMVYVAILAGSHDVALGKTFASKAHEDRESSSSWRC